jgi:very-short-patch-repair endonuclease
MDFPKHKPIDPTMKDRSRQLRRPLTPMEPRLWAVIRNRALNGLKFRRQFVIGHYIADFACITAKLVVEIDGNSHDGNYQYDKERTTYLEQCGYRVIRFTNQDIRENLEGVCEVIRGACLESISPHG